MVIKLENFKGWETTGAEEMASFAGDIQPSAKGPKKDPIMCICFKRHKDNKDIAHVSDAAWQFAQKFTGLSGQGKRPPVRTVPEVWLKDGRLIRGNYKSWTFLWWFRDRIIVVERPGIILFPLLVHEMTHAVMRRNDLPANETTPRAAADAAHRINPGDLT